MLMLVWLFAGCAFTPTPIDQTSVIHLDFECGQEMQIKGVLDLGSRQLSIRLPEENSQRILPQVLSGSGSKYSDGEVLIWAKGENAIIEWPNQKNSLNCRVHERK